MPTPAQISAQLPSVNALDVDSAQLDPSLAQAILSKIGSGQSLTPSEKMAAAKLPPSALSAAANSATAPLPSSVGIGRNPAAGAEPEPIRSPAPFAGNTAENEGLLANGHYAGTAYYDGSKMRDPAAAPNQARATDISPPGMATAQPAQPITPGFTGAPGGVSGTTPSTADSPTVKAAKAVAASPSTPAELKGLNGQQIAQMIGNILDVVGVGLSARGGVNRQTMLQKQQELKMQTSAGLAQKKGEAGIAVSQAQAMNPVEISKAAQLADIDIAKARVVLPLQAQVDLDRALRLNDYETANRIFEANQTIDAKTKVAVASAFGAKKAEINYLRDRYGLASGDPAMSAATYATNQAKGNIPQ